MEVLQCNKNNTKWYSKINYLKLLLLFVISFLLFSIVLYYIGGEKDLNNAISVSFIISILLSIGSIIGDFVENRSRIFVIDKDEVGYIDIHKEKSGSFLRDIDFKEVIKEYDILDIYKNVHKYEGIDKVVIKKVLSINRKNNRMIVKVETISKEWKSTGFFTISKLFLVDKESTKKLIIPDDYDKYEKLYKTFNKMM